MSTNTPDPSAPAVPAAGSEAPVTAEFDYTLTNAERYSVEHAIARAYSAGPNPRGPHAVSGVQTPVTEAVERIVATRVAEALRETARYLEYEMAPAWGGDSRWLSTGSHVADLVASVLRERAEEIEDA